MQTFWPTSDCFRNAQKMQGNFVFSFWRREAAEIVKRETISSWGKSWQWWEDSHKPFAALKMSFSLRGGGGDVMKNIEYNFCWNTVSIQTESRIARRQKYLATDSFVLKECEDTPVRSDLNIMKYLDIHCPGFIDTSFAEQDSGEKLLWTAHAKYGWNSEYWCFRDHCETQKALRR